MLLSDQAEVLARQLTLLTEARPLWQLATFEQTHLPWASDFPKLATLVSTLDLAEIDRLDSQQSELVSTLYPALAQDLAALGFDWQASELIYELALEPYSDSVSDSDHKPVDSDSGQNPADTADKSDAELPPMDDAPWLSHFSAHIKGRKWQQITGFTKALAINANDNVLEWCAGKGHLGRLIAKQYDATVTSVEWQADLCEQGRDFASQWQLNQSFVCGDAFAAQSHIFMGKQQAIALHACGDLHVSLMQQGVTHGIQQLAIAPCCYHLIRSQHYQGLSSTWQQQALILSKRDLQLALAQSSLASPRDKELRDQEMCWRLGFDSLQRYVRGENSYLPVPAIKRSQLSASFNRFCEWAMAQKGLNFDASIETQAWLAIGQQRLLLVRRLDLVSHLFRQLLEHALLLDRVA
ncbi:MAG: methyltransferase, partial [Shewanella sp.]